jgi:2-polyprenyl-3-methyl-5-hydroxy-6-metoxy-1,4-benzoquinol methylase
MTKSNEGKCQICGSKEWIDLPDPHPSKCVTTAGRIIDQPLGKSQCKTCGFVQRVRASFLGFSDYYENDYANYYERPGTEKFHQNRYKVMIEWMNQFVIGGNDFQNVLDVGCGQGWAMQVFSDLYPNVKIEGIEPSEYNVKRALQKGLTVHEGKLEDVNLRVGFYDFIFSNNVIQHVNNAEGFLSNLEKLVKKDGVVIITCPDGSRPNIEILWGDQNFSFLPQHLISLAKKSRFKFSFWSASSANASLPPAQLLLLTNNEKYVRFATDNANPNIEIGLKNIFERRSEYLGSFSIINQHILEETKASRDIYNFGASYWTSVLAAYCPDYWNRVREIVLDEISDIDAFLGKKVNVLKNVTPAKRDTLVLGIAPASHKVVQERQQDSWKKIITWNRFIDY